MDLYMVLNNIPLDFALFYHCAVKGNTILVQYEAVNILLLGNTYENNLCEAISQTAAANYVCGRKHISKRIMTDLLLCPTEKIIERLKKLQLQSPGLAVERLCRYMAKYYPDNHDNMEMLKIAEGASSSPYHFLADLFMFSIKNSIGKPKILSKDEQNTILLSPPAKVKPDLKNSDEIYMEPLQVDEESSASATAGKKIKPNKTSKDLASTTEPELSFRLSEFRNRFQILQAARYLLSFPKDGALLKEYLETYGTNIYRSLKPDEIIHCIDVCSNIKMSFITELTGSFTAIMDAALRCFSFGACAQFLCIAEMTKTRFNMFDHLYNLRQTLTEIHNYSGKETPIVFAFQYVDGLQQDGCRLRIVHSEYVCEENKKRGPFSLYGRKVENIDPQSDIGKIIPGFFTELPEKRYSILSTSDEDYDPEEDQINEATDRIIKLLTES